MNERNTDDVKRDIRKRLDKGNNEDVIMPATISSSELPEGYSEFLSGLKNRIRTECVKTVLSANSILVLMYWNIGVSILKKQKNEGWGSKIIDKISNDLRESFPEMKGFSARNLKYMRKFAETWVDIEIVQAVLAQISWYHNLALLEKLQDRDLRLWYAKKTIENGWSRNILVAQIELEIHKRAGKSINNFAVSLPPEESDMVNQIFKDPYLFDFLGTSNLRRENELEVKLIKHLEKFLLELGTGFSFVGRQVHIEVGKSDFYIDLLFYHLRLRCYVVVELKAGKFCPGHISQLNMYMNLVDEVLAHSDDKSTIGLLLVKEKNCTVVKYSLAGNTKPIGVAEWEQVFDDILPESLQADLPSVEEIESELSLGGSMESSR